MRQHYDIEKTDGNGNPYMVRVDRSFVRYNQAGPVQLSAAAKAKRAARKKQQKASRKANR